MKTELSCAALSVYLLSVMLSSVASAAETTTSAAPTDYCFHETTVRGSYSNLVIDHNLIIPPADQAKPADIYVGARFKSKPNELWLLSGITWRKINTNNDLLSSNALAFQALPLVVPVTITYAPMDVSPYRGDIEIWVGYGFRSATDSNLVSYAEMLQSNRYSEVWEALTSFYTPDLGLRNPTAIICLKTSEVNKTVLASQPN
ncbi:MAG TPA: hypothetical protein VMH83_07940 [Candidatus Acidoferrum sp.]|nr:hypothetical protein [Candidatus Acidoferrum sp.]